MPFAVTFRIATQHRTRHYKTEESAKRGIYKWLVQNQHFPDINASYFSPQSGYQSFDQPENLAKFAPKSSHNFYLSFCSVAQLKRRSTRDQRTPLRTM